MIRLLAIIILLASVITAQATTGDIIYQNCLAGGSGYCYPGTTSGGTAGWTRSVVSTGCYSGDCIKLDCTSPNANYVGGYTVYGAGNTAVGVTAVDGYSEITISMYIKVDGGWGTSLTLSNLKATRWYTGGSTFTGSEIFPWMNRDWYVDRMYGIITPASWFTMLDHDTNSAYPVNNHDGTWTSTQGWIAGNIGDGRDDGMQKTWVHVRKWIKLPTTPTGTDGAFKYWLNGELLMSITNMEMKEHGDTSFSYFTFFPSSESGENTYGPAGEPFYHWMDEIVVYEGYVPPSGTPTPGTCGTADGVPVIDTCPSTNLCATGSASSVTNDTDSCDWTCTVDTAVNCSAPYSVSEPAAPVASAVGASLSGGVSVQ